MLDYTGLKCPVCDTQFRTDDDIVVCPECGAPYHRACYEQKGECIFGELHAEGKEWQPPAAPADKAPTGNVAGDYSAEIKDMECPVCGTLNAHSAIFCNRCGTALKEQQYKAPPFTPPPHNPYPTNDTPEQRNAFGGTVPPFGFDPMGGVSPAEPLSDDITFGDASRVVKQSTAYYMPVFRYMKYTGRGKFNFSAFIFGGIWMLYRKQYKWGSVVTALMFLIYLAQLLVTAYISSPVLLEFMERVGADFNYGLTNEQLLAVSELMMQDLTAYFKVALPMIFSVLSLVLRIVVGVRGNKMYMKHCVMTAKRIKATYTGEGQGLSLDAAGGVNMPLAASLTISYLFLTNVLPLLL